jgi:hypothetical protein
MQDKMLKDLEDNHFRYETTPMPLVNHMVAPEPMSIPSSNFMHFVVEGSSAHPHPLSESAGEADNCSQQEGVGEAKPKPAIGIFPVGRVHSGGPHTITCIDPNVLNPDYTHSMQTHYTGGNLPGGSSPSIPLSPSHSSSGLRPTEVANKQPTDSSCTALQPAGQQGSNHQYLDITQYLDIPQSEAAKRLGIPTSTLSKRWREAVRSRKWPFRAVRSIDKQIMTLLHNVPQNSAAPQPLPGELEAELSMLLRKRQEELRPVIIRL